MKGFLSRWNPLIDDGDAFRLASRINELRKAGLDIETKNEMREETHCAVCAARPIGVVSMTRSVAEIEAELAEAWAAEKKAAAAWHAALEGAHSARSGGACDKGVGCRI
jgi:hypothetical protein